MPATTEEAVFLEALQKTSAEARAAFLSQACAGDDSRRRSIDLLLQAHELAGDFLRQPPPATIDQPPSEQPGTLIGRYKLLEQVGEGGMGVVYVAEQTEPVRRRVALKIIKPGMDTKQVIARFEAERQALAMMDHPNIARVLDAGTTEAGRPYFVMELVRGMPITEYCDKARLSPRQRLELFVDVCQAVQHAHQKGIIHRDLKPSNVMVTMQDGRPVVKVIDFGVAKAVGQQLTERTVYTALTQLVGTPLYMSPEQAELTSHDVDTRSDIYSLGVLLYELLTGQTPFDKETLSKAGLDEMRRIIREDEPLRPSRRFSTLGAAAISTASQHRGVDERRLSRILCGELDWIVMKALEKDRSRRYESASALAIDIQRYLSDEPVLACPPTTMYRFQKFARKHKPALVTAAAIAACLILGTTVSAWQAVRATTAEAQANANEAQAKQAAAAEAQQRQRAEANEQRANSERDEVRALNEKLQRTLYAANMTLAKHAWDEAAVPRVLELLEQHRPKPGQTDLRGFEWHYLYRLCHSELLVLKGGFGVAFSPDGRRLAGGSQTTLKVWDSQSGMELLSLQGHTDAITSVAFSPDGELLASAAWDKTVKVRNARTGQELQTFMGHSEPLTSVAFSPDGKRLASGDESGKIKVWDAQSGQEIVNVKGHAAGVKSVAFSPDGKRLASADWHETVIVWDGESGQELRSIKSAGSFVTFSPDGKRLASASGEHDYAVKVLDAQTGKELVHVKAGHAGMVVNCVAFSPDGKRLASAGGDRTVRIWNSESGQELVAFKGHTNMANSVAFSPDGTRLASAAREGNRRDGTVRVWDATTSSDAPTIGGLTGTVTSIAFSPDGKRRAVGIRAWDDNKQAFTAGELKVLDAQTNKELINIKGLAREVLSLVFSPDGKRLAGGDDKAAKVWDAQTGRELVSFKRHRNRVTRVVFSPDGKRLASVDGRSIDGYRTVRVWDAQSGQEQFNLNGASIVAFSSDGTRLVGILGGAVKLWDAHTGQEIPSFQGGKSSFPYPPESGNGMVALSPDGKRLAKVRNESGVAEAGEVQVLDAHTGQELLSLKGHTALASSVAFSPDGKRLASGSGSGAGTGIGEIKLWDAETGHELLNLKAGFVGRVEFSPDGHWLLINDANGTLKIYNATPLPEKP